MAITTYTTTPLSGMALNDKSSTLADFRGLLVGTQVLAQDGFAYMLVRADTAHASTANILVSSGGLFSADTAASAGVANFVCRTTGGVTAGQYFWARSKKLAALS